MLLLVCHGDEHGDAGPCGIANQELRAVDRSAAEPGDVHRGVPLHGAGHPGLGRGAALLQGQDRTRRRQPGL
eukprot:2462638-Rhodomonas_salina.3